MKVIDFPIVKLTLCLVIGIILGAYCDIPFKVSLIISASLLCFLFVGYLISRQTLNKNKGFAILVYFTMISVGISIKNLHNQQNFNNHYSNVINLNNDDLHLITITITENLKSNPTFNRYVAKITKVDSITVIGEILVNFKRDSIHTPLNIDTQLILKGRLQELYPALNPYQFDYKTYLNHHNIYAQVYSDFSLATVESTKIHSVFGYADYIRRKVISKLENYHFEPNEMAVIKALFLGQRQDISNELRQQYVDAGAIHILAISGLHVGIILIILNNLFRFFRRFKKGYIFKTIIILILLWAFAIIAGLSPSVLRAVTMFSAVAIAMNLKRPYNIYNTLAISAFVLLLFNPMLLFEIGFQLSYLAVIGIVSIQPLLFNAIKTKYWFINKVLILLTVSIAAQIGVLPLSLFYFHQFPGLFFISNVVIIPFLGFILSCGFIVIVLALFNVPYNFLVLLFETLIRWMNQFFNWVSLQDTFIFKNISFTLIMTISCYLLIVCITRLSVAFNYKKLIYALISIVVFQSVCLYTNYSNKTSSELVIFHKSRHSVIGKKQGDVLLLSHDLDSVKRRSDFIIQNYTVGNFIDSTKEDNMSTLYKLNRKTLLVVDSIGVYRNLSFQPDYVLLRQSPKVNLNRLLDSLKIKTVVADGSNYISYVKRWQQTCLKQNIPFHYTGKKGAFIIK
ncbi:ComEC/Rec2 family competence protein [Hanstruepera marina]|uniref:ComEC/Rec2 family competence protein n=1 Tax=Hanstruepera marina TaxID=2873265 RepID=UPI001CA6AC1F